MPIGNNADQPLAGVVEKQIDTILIEEIADHADVLCLCDRNLNGASFPGRDYAIRSST